MLKRNITLICLLSSFAVLGQVSFMSSTLPIVVINTNGIEILDEPRIIAQMGIINNPSGKNNVNDKFNEYDGPISIEIRGTTSQSFPKKQYALETQHTDGTNDNVSLLGLPKENDWILHGPYSDKTLMRNYLSSYFAHQMGHYAPRMRYCELVLNNEYMGIYLFCESIKEDKNRISIQEIENEEDDDKEEEESDITGGYIFKIDRADDSRYNWVTNLTRINIICDYPKPEVLKTSHKNYIKNLIDRFEEALFSDHFGDPLQGYLPYIDLNTFVDFFIINELAKNIDAYRLSTYFYKNSDPIDPKLKMGPVWDFNIAYGNVDYQEGYLDSGFIANRAPWWDRLLQDTTFNNAVKDRWIALRNKQLLKEHIFETIDSIAGELDKPIKRNFSRWDVLGKDIWPNYYIGQNYPDEIDYLKDWFDRRITWLDFNLPGESNLILPFEKNNFKLYPNPFYALLNMDLQLKYARNISLLLYNSQGRQIKTLINNELMQAGNYKLQFDNAYLSNLPSQSVIIAVLFADGQMIDNKKIIHY